MTFFTRLVVSILGTAFAVVVALGVLSWLALYVVYATLRWLLTGRKPQVLLMWQQIQAMRQGMQAAPRHRTHDVVEDIVVREIHTSRSLPKD